MIIRCSNYEAAKHAVKQVLQTDKKIRQLGGDTIVIYIDKGLTAPIIDDSTDNQRGKVDLYRRVCRHPHALAQLGNVMIAMDELHRRKSYLFDNPTDEPIVISVNSIINAFADDLFAFEIL